MRRLWLDWVALLLIIGIIGVFFLPFFWPKPQLLVTPDFGTSDSWHLSFSTKYLLWESLQKNQLPFWSAQIGSGFPLLGEGEIGMFFLPNLVYYKFFNPVSAYNLSLFTAVITVATGMYFWIRIMGIGKLLALYAALTIALSGNIIAHLTHITLLQGFSLLPWVMAVTLFLANQPRLNYVGLLALIIAQQILAGFPQASFITLLLAMSYYLWLIYPKGQLWRQSSRFILGLLLGITLGAIQLLPSWEFLQNSSASGGFPPEIASYFSFPFKHLRSFVNPFALGNPKYGTYPPFADFSGSIFWENTGYLGLVPLIFALVLLLFKPKTKHALFFGGTLFVSFLLMLGSHSPLYFIYSFWPFNLFRVPSRFLWIFVVSLLILSVKGANLLQKRLKYQKLALLLIALSIGFNTFHLFSIWRSYHLLVPAKDWLTLPPELSVLDPDGRTLTIGAQEAHNQVFLKQGWQKTAPYYFFRNLASPNSNLIWDIASAEVAAGRFLYRATIMSGFWAKEVQTKENETAITDLGYKLLNLSSISSLIAPQISNQGQLIPVGSLAGDTAKFIIYDNPHSLPRAYLASKVVTATTAESALAKIKDPSFRLGESVLLEKPFTVPETPALGQVQLIKIEDNLVKVLVKSNDAARPLILTDTYYPGWKALLNGKPVEILAANISQRAVVVPPGDHEVTFVYQPLSFRFGVIISVVTLLFTVLLVVFPLRRATSRTRQKWS